MPALDLPALGIFVAALTLAGAFASALDRGGSGSRRFRRRLERVKGTSTREGGRGPTPATMRRRQTRSVLGGAVAWLAFLVPRAAVLRRHLDRADIGLSAVDFSLLCLALAVACGLFLGLIAGLPVPLAAGAGAVLAILAPHLLVTSRVNKRVRRFVGAFPDAIDLMVRGIRSGLPVAEAIQTVAQEAHGIVAETFREISGNLMLGMNLNDALWTAARRLDIQEFKFFVISLSIQQDTGGNLAEIMQNLSQMMRRREQVKLRVKAMSSEARASAMIIGSLPFIMFVLIYFVNRDYMMTFFIDPRGWMMLAAGGTSLMLGIGVMAKMVRFEI